VSNVDKIPEQYLWCRDVQHSWDPYNAKVSRNKITRRNEVHQVLICTRCSTLKTRMMTTGGEMLRTSYSYPEGYLLTQQGPMTPADRAMIRKINLKNALAAEDGQQT
jgi:hypothetical protein